jgi:hypothetical protein
MLHRKINSHSTRTITDEIEGGRKTTSGKQVMEKIIEGALHRLNSIRLNIVSFGGAYSKNFRGTKVGRQRLVTRRPFIHLDGFFVVDTFGSRDLTSNQRKYLACLRLESSSHTISHSTRLFSRSRRYRSNRGHISMHVPTIVIASSSRLATLGSSILPSAIASFRSTSRAFTSCELK